jgi:hypothetical protein
VGKRIPVAIAFSSLWLATPAAAQESKCLSRQLKASGAYAEALAKCEAKAAAKGETVDPVCIAKAAKKVANAFTKAEGRDDCVVSGTPVAEAVDERVEEMVVDINAILNPPPMVCCAVGVSTCLFTEDAAACSAPPYDGVPGAEGSVCTGDGTCSSPPAAAGGCCQDFTGSGGLAIDCANGSVVTAKSCGALGGTFSTAVCTPSGLCL